jgi:CRISPR-associated protein Csb2
VYYSSLERPLGRPYIIFALRRADGEFFPEAQARLIHVAGMARHAAICAMDIKKGFPPPGLPDPAQWVEYFVAGHRNGRDDHQQFSYVPLPSIGHEHADAMIRRVMIIAPHGFETHLRHLAEQLDGCQLEREHGGEASILERLRGDGVTRLYTQCAKTWATVTPVILPGCDDHKPTKTRKLMVAALRQSGIEQPCEFTWSAVPNFPHCLPAYSRDRHGRPTGYFRPDHLHKFSMVHVRITFQNQVAGPLVIGAGRHYGFGLLAEADRTA